MDSLAKAAGQGCALAAGLSTLKVALPFSILSLAFCNSQGAPWERKWNAKTVAAPNDTPEESDNFSHARTVHPRLLLCRDHSFLLR